MKAYKSILLIISIIFVCSIHGQTIKKDSLIIPGTWLLTKHTITKQGATIDSMYNNRVSTYIFFNNGTYQLIDKDLKSQFKTIGKWKITESGKKLHLFDNNDVPNDPKIEIADHDMNIILLGKEYYLTYSWRDSQVAPETDYYKKK